MDFDSQRRAWSTSFLAAVGKNEWTGTTVGDERRRLIELVHDEVLAGPGFVVMTGLDSSDSDLCRRVLLWVSEALGTVLPQDKAGARIREVRDRGTAIGEGESARYADSRHGGHLHTDGAERPFPLPDYFTLFCVRPAKVGGALKLVPVEKIRERLSDRPATLEVLGQDFHFDRRGDQPPGDPATATKPVLFETADGRQAATYLRRYIEVGHRRPEVADLSAEQQRALDALDHALGDPALAIEGCMRPGELAVFDNLRLLHGRTEFQDHDAPDRARLLYRTWICRTAPAENAARR